MIVSSSPGRSTLHLYICMLFNDWQIWHWQVHFVFVYIGSIVKSTLYLCVWMIVSD